MSLQQIHDEIALREASLLDAQREFAAGELSEAALEEITQRERAALAHLRDRLALLESEVTEDVTPRPVTRRVRKKRWLLVAALAFAVAVAVILWSSLAPRQAGNSMTGSLSLSTSQQISRLLVQAEDDIANGNVVAALSAYENVLSLAPKNVTALTQVGWLDFSAGSSSGKSQLVRLGLSDLQAAIIAGPRNPAPRLYYAIAAFSIPGNTATATRQFEEFLALKPSTTQLAIATPYLKRLGISAG